jgi:hypothetical protein
MYLSFLIPQQVFVAIFFVLAISLLNHTTFRLGPFFYRAQLRFDTELSNFLCYAVVIFAVT